MLTLLAPSRALDARVRAALNGVKPAVEDEVPQYSATTAAAVEAFEAFLKAHPNAGIMLIGPDPTPNGRYYCSIALEVDGPEGECEGASIALAISGALIEAGALAAKAGGAAA